MSSSSPGYRRYEILLPRLFNDGTPVPDDAFVETLLELESKFGSVSAETQTIEGRWRHAGRTYHDRLARIFVDVPDEPEYRAYFEDLKRQLKERFKQIDIWMTSYRVDVL